MIEKEKGENIFKTMFKDWDTRKQKETSIKSSRLRKLYKVKE